MSRSKSLTFKSPDRMKLLAMIFAFAFIFSPSVRYSTSQVLHTVADLIEQ